MKPLLGVIRLWEKITPSKAIDESGQWEKKFFERVYRLAFVTGLSYTDDSISYRAFQLYVLTASVLMLFLELWHACFDNLNLDEIISAFGVILIHILTFWKIITMVHHRATYKKLAKSFEAPYFDTSTIKRRQLANDWSNTHKRFLTRLLIVSNSTLFFWNTYPLIDDVEYNLVAEIGSPIYYRTTIRYVIAYIIVVFLFNTTSFVVIMSEVIMQAFLLPLICQFSVLADCFENVFEDCARDFEYIERGELINNESFINNYKKRLGNLIDQHLMILNYTMNLKAILSGPMLGQLCGSGMLICFVGYQAIATPFSENPGKFMMSVGYLGYNMFTLYLICRWCEEITSQSQKIGEAVYFSGWENGMSMVPGVKATIMLVILRSNKPLEFLAGGMYTINLSSYTNLVKASYSALNLLLRMSND